MTKQQYIHLVIIVLLFALATGFNYYIRVVPQTENYAAQINSYLQGLEKDVENIFDDKNFIKRQIDGSGETSAEIRESDFKVLEKLEQQVYTITVFQKDSLLFWSNNLAIPELSDFAGATAERKSRFIKSKNGSYELIFQQFGEMPAGDQVICALIPIRYQYSLESDYLKNEFLANHRIPQQYQLSAQENPFPIISRNGTTLCYLSQEKNLISTMQLQIGLWLYLLAFIALLLLFNNVSGKMIRSGRPWLGAVFLIISIFGVRFISLLFDFSSNFSDLSLFGPTSKTGMSSTLGDLLINIVLLLWIMVFFHKEFPVRSYDHLGVRTRFGVTTLNYLSILAAIFVLTGVFKALVFNTNLTFDFENVFNLDSQNLFAVTGVILLLIALFLFSHRMMLTIVKIGMSREQRLMALGIATAISIPLLFWVNFIISPFYLLLIAFVFILVFDLFIDSGATNFTWLVIWLVILSAFPSILLFRYNSFKDRIMQMTYAEELAVLKDSLAETAFQELKNDIENKSFLEQDIPPFPFKLNKETLLKKVDEHYSNQSYLFYNYTYDVYGFDRYGNPAIEGQLIGKQAFDEEMNSSEPASKGAPRFRSGEMESGTYFMEANVPAADNAENSIILGFKFQKKGRDQSKVYTELLIDKPFKDLKNLSKYDYAIYKNNHRIDEEGNVYGNFLSTDDLPEKGKMKEILDDHRSELIYNSEDGILVIIGKPAEDYMKKAISLFSYIFSWFFAFILFLALINTSVKILPDSLKFYLVKKPSLKNRIQLSVIGLIVVSFIIIGFVTVWFFKTSSNDYHETSLERKTNSVEVNALHELSSFLKDNDSISDIGQINLEKFNIAEPLSKIHRMDVNLYDLSGKLINSSEEDIFKKGIISGQMGALAFNALKKQNLSEYFQEHERIGKLNYKSAYIPLRVNGKSIAYLGLPYYSKQNELRSDITVFISTLMNVYVFLLLVASGFAIAVANSITNPIAIIGDKLKQLKLGNRNEELEWKNQDELGDLIAEYNRMIKKLAESAEKLAQSEREGAWREMAKQVAHEIKNPLTPMKLSIQYLMHAFKSNSDDLEPLLKRVTSTLVEQIDNLAQIASEFSNFAKMPRAENQKISINALVSSVYDLFCKGVNMDISIHLPSEEFFVYADKNHLMRVLNNLMKNAEQSIPDDRNGVINVELYRLGHLVVIKVTDNGSGIADDKKDKVFVPNFTTKSSGTGLGLAISKNIIESVNGEIYFKTAVGIGTEFFVQLPIVEVNELEQVKEAV